MPARVDDKLLVWGDIEENTIAQARKAAGSVTMEILAGVVFIVFGYQKSLVFKDQPLDLA